MPSASPTRRPLSRPGRARTSAGGAPPAATAGGIAAPSVPFEGRIRWDRVGRVALLGLLAVVLLLYVAPLRHWVSQSRAASLQRAEMHTLVHERNELAARALELGRPETVESEARRLGMVRRGERAFVVEPAPARR